ncbi:hypothetical protein K227x_27660 [Rubripirellula lacrimiformis]|uniref:DUF4476 domain-containing protein n=1 Tax=Rubripirellula lacrimiformis TaxID=1930273 RepID=A0A517NB68_9BACT|nr:hypothetical protein [Rubripirellula lacrimiformis]QDT04375.1 hypothetical protein K227x_27660 [Rubripirellula lacrimiformis]
MRIAAVTLCLFVSSSLAYVAIGSKKGDWRASQNPLFTDVLETRDSSLFDQFISTLDPVVIKACVAEHETSGKTDLDQLAKCGDFDLYARYMRISKFDAVKKFNYVLLNSSSKLEFEDRLAR